MSEHRVRALLERMQALRTRRPRSKFYLERATQMRRFAETEKSERLRGEWLDLAQRYDALADVFAEAEDKASC